MISRWKSLLKDAFYRLGLEVRFAAKHDALSVQRKLLAGRNVRTIVDGGAYHGEWTAHYRRAFPSADVYLFEPFPESQEILQATFSGDAKSHLVPRAIGERCESRVLHANKLAATSSLLPVDERVREKLPDPEWVASATEITVDVTDLDSFCDETGVRHIDLLKLDLQGHELAALRGARKLLERRAIDLIYTEMLFMPHYVGQAYHFQICDYLHGHGYQLFGLYNLGVLSSGQMLQADAIFLAPQLQS